MRSFVYWVPTQAAQCLLEAVIMCAVPSCATRNRLKFGTEPRPRLLEVQIENGDVKTILEHAAGSRIHTRVVDGPYAIPVAVNEILAEIRPATQSSFGLGGHSVILQRDGSLEVGCQSFTKDEADRITAIVKAMDGGTVDVTHGGVRIRTHPDDKDILMVGDHGMRLNDVRDLVRRREEFLAAPQSAQQVRIF